jgi:hypothetical protein
MLDKKINQGPKRIVQACGKSFALSPLFPGEHAIIDGRV